MQALKNRIAPILGGLKGSLKGGLKKARLEQADQILLGLKHSGSALLEQTLRQIENNPADVIGRIGRSVLQRAQLIRGQMTPSGKAVGSSTANRSSKASGLRTEKQAVRSSKAKGPKIAKQGAQLKTAAGQRAVKQAVRSSKAEPSSKSSALKTGAVATKVSKTKK